MLKMPTYNKNTHTKGKKKKQTASLPLLFYPQTLQCPNTKQVSRRKNKHTNKHTHTKKEKLKKKKKFGSKQYFSSTTECNQERFPAQEGTTPDC